MRSLDHALEHPAEIHESAERRVVRVETKRLPQFAAVNIIEALVDGAQFTERYVSKRRKLADLNQLLLRNGKDVGVNVEAPLADGLNREYARRNDPRSIATANRTGAYGSPHYEDGYAAAVATLRRAGIEAEPDAGSYADQRRRWEPLIRRVAPTFGYEMDEIDLRRPGQTSSDGKSANRRWSRP